MAFIWGVLLLILPLLYGGGVQSVLYRKSFRKEPASLSELYIMGIIMEIGLAGLVHAAGLFLHLSISTCTMILGVLWMAAGLLCLLPGIRLLQRGEWKALFAANLKTGGTKWDLVLPGLLCLMMLGQVIILLSGELHYPKDSMMGETVTTFLSSDGIWQVNPMTGQAYELGVPTRLKLLVLPTLYSVLCRLTQTQVPLLLCRWVPVFILAAAYMAYQSLGKVLFGRNCRNRRMFLLLVSLLFIFGNDIEVMDGFGLRYGGFLATTIRNTVLLPFTLSMALQKKWRVVLLCILAEACIMWTLYGMGMCLAAVLLLQVTERAGHLNRRDKEAA
jgi:hypothetical protein